MKKISFPKDVDRETDEVIRSGMGEQVVIPDEVRYAKDLAYARVKGMEKNRIKDLETAAQSQNGSHHLHEVKHEMEHRNMGRKYKWEYALLIRHLRQKSRWWGTFLNRLDTPLVSRVILKNM